MEIKAILRRTTRRYEYIDEGTKLNSLKKYYRENKGILEEFGFGNSSVVHKRYHICFSLSGYE